jgi:hypothetical protein
LEKVSIGIYDLKSFDFLDDLPLTIKELCIEKTESKKPSIGSIQRFTDLEYLYLEGQQNGIGAINKLRKLERIVLRSISTKDVSYLEGLENLWSVDIKLGGIKNLDSLAKVKNLKYLELWQILGLADLSFITDIPSLQYLFIQSLKRVTKLPRLDRSYNLRRLYLENLKGLTDLSSLEFAPALDEFCYVVALNQRPENLLLVLRNKNVKSVLCGLGGKKQSVFDELVLRYGKQTYSYSEFQFS